MDEIANIMQLISFGIAILGSLILIYGVAISFSHWLRIEKKFWGGLQITSERISLRHQLAYYLLLSLEFLIAADIIHTIIKPGFDELIILGGILAIRTVISLSLNWEMKSKSDA